MGMGAASKYVSGTEESFTITWDGEHSPEHHQKLTTMLRRMKLRTQNINEMLASDTWDDPRPLEKRKRSKEWKLLKEEFGKMLANG
jgi:hypothetical protein